MTKSFMVANINNIWKRLIAYYNTKFQFLVEGVMVSSGHSGWFLLRDVSVMLIFNCTACAKKVTMCRDWKLLWKEGGRKGVPQKIKEMYEA